MTRCRVRIIGEGQDLVCIYDCRHDFPYKNIFHRETANRSRTSVTFLFLANASRRLHFRILLDSEKLRVFGLYAIHPSRR